MLDVWTQEVFASFVVWHIFVEPFIRRNEVWLDVLAVTLDDFAECFWHDAADEFFVLVLALIEIFESCGVMAGKVREAIG